MGQVVAITGGIGSGKSVVSSILRVMGYSVCDTDSFAKKIMENSEEIKLGLRNLFGENIINADNQIDRAELARIVFNDNDALKRLNKLAHPVITAEIINWARVVTDNSSAFIETAILNESGLRMVVDMVWYVDAPETIRVDRVVKRNNISSEEVWNRINAQKGEVLDLSDTQVRVITNDNNSALIPQINFLLEEL